MFRRILPVLLLAVSLTGCQLKPNPVTWDDIARTIPSSIDYVVSVNTDYATDTTLNRIWADDDVIALINEGLALDSVMPSHFVVVSFSGATYVTWPLPNPRETAEKVDDWQSASLNNTVDAHIVVRGNAGLVLSSTQAWVVNDSHADEYVNNLLSAAMNTKAANVQPFARCIKTDPQDVAAVIPYDNKYYTVDLNHENGLLRVDADAFDKLDRRVELVSGFGRLPAEYVDSLSSVSPFAAVQVDRGNMPDLLRHIAKIIEKPVVSLAVGMVASYFNDVEGTVTAIWNNNEAEVKIPFASAETARTVHGRIASLAKKGNFDVNLTVRADTMIYKTKADFDFPPVDKDRHSPHWRTQTEHPSAVAFARVDLGKGNPVEAYFELAPTHARLQIDYKENPENLSKVTNFVRTLIFRTL